VPEPLADLLLELPPVALLEPLADPLPDALLEAL
jgi:hypothetical protein